MTSDYYRVRVSVYQRAFLPNDLKSSPILGREGMMKQIDRICLNIDSVT